MVAKEPSAAEFFATANGVSLYVNVDGRAIRVEFSAADRAGTARGVTSEGAAEALVVATRVVTRSGSELKPLFDLVARQLAHRE